MKYLQEYEAAGVKIDAITSQNETDTDQAGQMPACAWAQEHEVVFVGKHLGPALAEANLKTKIWILDHNFNLWGRAYNTLEDPDVFRYVDGVAWHPYVGSVTAMTRIHDAFPSKHQYMTEGAFGAMANLVGPVAFAATPRSDDSDRGRAGWRAGAASRIRMLPSRPAGLAAATPCLIGLAQSLTGTSSSTKTELRISDRFTDPA